jgi:multidrug efflux pump subunit AcrB
MIEFFLTRRVLTNLITVFIVVVGGWQAYHVKREAFPDVDFDIVTVTTPYPGASPEEVERLITTKIEDQIRGVSGIDKVLSYSLEGRSVTTIILDENLKERQKYRAVNDIEQAVDRVRDLPDVADKPVVQELTSDRPLITLSVAGGDDETRHRFAEELKDALEDIPGVSKVEYQGFRKREVWIEADREELTRHRLTLAEIAGAVRSRNLDTSAGTVETGPQEVWVRVVGSVFTAREVGDIILRGNDARAFIRIRDVARVTESFEEQRLLAKANGKPSIDLNVRKLQAGDTIELADAVKALKARYEPRARELGTELVLSDDISFFIKRRLHVMTNNLIQGGVLILLALFLFLDWRLALVAAAGVPISFAAAFLVAVPLGFTINLMTLMALIIVLGMLDDDSVVVAENVYRHMEMGKPPLQAAVDGTREVIVPVLASVSATACGFLPFALMSGIMGKFLFMIPVVVIMAFAASVFEAFFILPSHVADLMPFGRPVEGKSDGRWYTAILVGYRRAMGWLLHRKTAFFFIVIGFVGVTALVARWRLKLVLFPPGLIDQFFIQVDMPQGTGLTETERVFRRVEETVLKLPPSELESVRTSIGLKGIEETIRLGTHYGQARVFLTPEESRPRKTKVIVAQLRRELESFPEVDKLVFEELHPGPPVGRAITVRVRGRDPLVSGRIADRVKAELASLPGVVDIADSREGGKNQVQVVLDDREAAFAGLDVGRVAQNVLFAIDGGEASVIRRPSETDEVKVKVRLLPEQRARTEELLNLDVLNPQGRPVRLGSVARLERRQGPPFLERYNFKPAVTVTADVQLDKITSNQANQHLQKAFAGLKEESPGYELVYGGEFEETQKSMKSLGKAFGVAILLDFVILAAVFRSYVQPFIILLTIPIGLLGVVYALLLHGKPASFMALLGVVAMTGVVVNNAIVLVSFINQRREEGASAEEAAVDGGATRLRPIWASSITTLLGLFPTAYGFGGHEPFVAPMALTLAWGLTIAMPMTLFLIPAAYVFTEDVKSFLARWSVPAKDALVRRIKAVTRGRAARP